MLLPTKAMYNIFLKLNAFNIFYSVEIILIRIILGRFIYREISVSNRQRDDEEKLFFQGENYKIFDTVL
jgi:hypothetical protein